MASLATHITAGTCPFGDEGSDSYRIIYTAALNQSCAAAQHRSSAIAYQACLLAPPPNTSHSDSVHSGSCQLILSAVVMYCMPTRTSMNVTSNATRVIVKGTTIHNVHLQHRKDTMYLHTTASELSFHVHGVCNPIRMHRISCVEYS